ncbi:MAG: MarR family winged helix-turn-helix transcriptional regulator [Actinomycetota bacterium]|jgi:DNA-binding MarR family transcriptional regulator|nr:MarR family winged helix-turn-helix transcriptional regulator [Actinomycetota bacterium]
MSRRISSPTPEEVLQAEADIRQRLEDRDFDFLAMSAVSNVYRAGTAVRNHMERTVLADFDLSWVAFTVLWVLWIWGAQETGHVAQEAGVTKGTLTGVMKTLQGQRLIKRTPHRDDRRRVSISLSAKGQRLISELFPAFNQHEVAAVSALSAAEQHELARLLRKVTNHITSVPIDESSDVSA